MDEQRLRKLAGLNEAQITGSQLLSHVIKVMKKLKFTIISADKVEGGVVVVRTRASDFALDAKMSAILGKDKFFVAVTMSAREAIFRFESELKESVERVDEQFTPKIFFAQMDQLVKDGKRDKKLMEKVLDMSEDEDSRSARVASEFLDLVDAVWDQENQKD